MTAATDTTTEPATECAGMQPKLFSNFIVFIFYSCQTNDKKEKPLCRWSPQRGLNFYIPSFLSTITSRTDADNYDDGNNNNADNVVEKLSHLILISFEISLIYHLFFIISRGEEKKIIFF